MMPPDPRVLPGAPGWGAYQLKQEEKHPLTLAIDGKPVGVSRDISAKAMDPYRQEFDAWKRDVSWDQLKEEAHQRIA